jgi:hypothetical protein
MPRKTALIHLPALVSSVERRIFVMRGHKVMLDVDLAELYGVPTKRLNEQVKRNRKRFPEDFMFRLTAAETRAVMEVRSQFATLKRGRHRKYLPYVFTEQGVAMLSSVLNSDRSIAVNIIIMRAFVKLRQLSSRNKEIVRRLSEMEKKYDAQFRQVFRAIRELMEPPPEAEPPRRSIGFLSNSGKSFLSRNLRP